MRWTADRAYVAISSVVGLFFVFVTPPFQSPDEVNHFLRIYHLSEGRIVGEKYGETSGGEVPTAVWIEAHHFDRLPFDPDSRTSAREIVRHLLYGPRFGADTDGPRQFGAFPNTVRYSPAPYLPHVLALLVARAAGVTVLAGTYACRLAALAVAILLIRGSLRLVPDALGWSLASLALLPMGLFITSMASPDAVIISVALAIFGLTVWLRTHPAHAVPRLTWIAAAALIVVISLSKIGYFLIPAALAVALFPRVTGRWRRAALLAAAIAVALALSAAWLTMIAGARTPGREDPAINPEAQLARVIDNPMVFVDALWFDVSRRWPQYYDSFIGKLGWLDVPLPRWTLTVLTILFVLFALTRCRSEAGSPFTLVESTLLAAIPILTFLITALLQYLDWVTVGAGDLRAGLQGRYFYPVVPALLVIAPRLPLSDAWARYRPAVFMLGYGVCLIVTGITLLQRYYG